jgi:hypothetical protein
MSVEVNWAAVLLATLSTMVVGSVWYTPKVFGKKWEKLARIDPKHKANAVQAIAITLVVSFITAYILAHVIFLANNFFGNTFLTDAMATAFWVWLGFTAARFITHDAFENRPKQLTLMNIAHELVTFMVMALIIGLLPPAGASNKNCDLGQSASTVCSAKSDDYQF